MASISESGTVISFAEYSDVLRRDQRLFDNNESLTDDVVEQSLERATDRIITKIRNTEWWQSYFLQQDGGTTSIRTRADIPSPTINNITGRSADFTDLCVYLALSEFILPSVADFGVEDDAERQKMGYYTTKFEMLFEELIIAGDWYDFDGDTNIVSSEKEPGQIRLKRIR